MARRRRDELAQAIQQVLAPSAFVGYRDSWEFVKDVEAVREQIAPLIGTGEAPRAVALLETFIAGCYEKFGALTKPACIAGVRVSRPNFNALCGQMKL